MKKTGKRWAVLALVLASALLFAACGGENGATGTPGGSASQQDSSPVGAEGDNGKGDADVTAGTDGKTASSGNVAGEGDETGDAMSPDDIAESPAAGEPPAQTKEVEVEVEGMKETRKGTLAVSDNGYHLYVIPPFVFAAEEPGVDTVYMEAFPDYSMRIQALPEDSDLAFLRQNAEEELEAAGGSFEELKGDAIYDSFLRGAEFHLQSIDGEMVKKIIVMRIDGLLFRFTMFLPVGGEASEGAEAGFNAMIKTIRAN